MLLCLPCCHKIGNLKAMGECNAEIAFVGNMGMRVTLRQRGRKDYALLNANGWCIFLLLLMLLRFFCLINAYKMFLCIFFYLVLSIFLGGFLVWCWFFKCGAFWSLDAPSDGDLLWLFLCGWSGSRPESQPLEIL